MSRIDKINVPDTTKIDVVRHFLTGMANSHISEHKFIYNTWAEFKKYLLNKYIINKTPKFISLQKQLDNITSNGESIHALYNRISEIVNLLP